MFSYSDYKSHPSHHQQILTQYRNPTSHLITFHKNPSKYTAILAYMGSTITNPKWDLSQGRYSLWGFRQQLINYNIGQIRIQQIVLKNNQKQKEIVKEIVGVNWSKLKKIVLDGNNIQSIQYLCAMYAPQLQSLSLNKNNITKLRTLQKLNFPNLTTLQLKLNLIKQLQKISTFNLPKLKQLQLQSSIDSQQQAEDLNMLCKTQFCLEWIFIASSKRIRDYKQIFRKRYGDSCQIKGKYGVRVYNIVRNNVMW